MLHHRPIPLDPPWQASNHERRLTAAVANIALKVYQAACMHGHGHQGFETTVHLILANDNQL